MGWFDGGGWNPFQGVSWQKPFGDSSLGQGLRTFQSNLGQGSLALRNTVSSAAGMGKIGGQSDNGQAEQDRQAANAQTAQDQANQQAQQQATQQAADQKKKSDLMIQGQNATNQANTLENAIMANYRRSRGAGQNLYGGF